MMCLLIMENSIYQIKINPKKIILYLRHPVHGSQLQNSVYASSGKAKIRKNTQTLKGSCKKKKSMGIDLVFITGANPSVRVTAPYATRKLQKCPMKCLPPHWERSFLRWIDRMQRYSFSVLIWVHTSKEMQWVTHALHLM